MSGTEYVDPRTHSQVRTIIDIPERSGVLVSAKLVLAILKTGGANDRRLHPYAGAAAVLANARLYLNGVLIDECRQAGRFLAMRALAAPNAIKASQGYPGMKAGHGGFEFHDGVVEQAANYHTYTYEGNPNVPTNNRDTTPETTVDLAEMFPIATKALPLGRGPLRLELEYRRDWALSAMNKPVAANDWFGSIEEPLLIMNVVDVAEDNQPITYGFLANVLAQQYVPAAANGIRQTNRLQLGFAGEHVKDLRIAFAPSAAPGAGDISLVGNTCSTADLSRSIRVKVNGKYWYASQRDMQKSLYEFMRVNGGQAVPLTSWGLLAVVGDAPAQAMINPGSALLNDISKQAYAAADFHAASRVNAEGIQLEYERTGGAGYLEAKDVLAYGRVARTVFVSAPGKDGRAQVAVSQ